MDRSVSFLVGFAFIVGVLMGYIFQGPISSIFGGQKQIFACPSIESVLANKENASPWDEGELQWSALTQGNQLPDKIVFFQAVLQRAGNNLVCYYRYQKPGYQGTFDNHLVQLNPSANQLIIQDGTHWRNSALTATCLSGDVQTCGFNVEYR